MSFIYIVFFIRVQYLRTMEIEISLINSYLAFCFLLFSMTTLSQLGVHTYITFLPSDFRVAYAANIPEHHNHQTPGTKSPTLFEQCLGSLTSHKINYEEL